MVTLKDIVIVSSTNLGMSLSPANIITSFAITLSVIIAFYILRSIGLYTLAKNNNIKNPKLVFIPLYWIYVAGKLSKTKIFFGRRTKNFPLFAVIFMSATTLIVVALYTIIFFPIVGFYLQGGQIFISLSTSGIPTGAVEYQLVTGLYTVDFANPYLGNYWLISLLNVMSLSYDIASVFGIIVMVTVYSNLFRRFWPQRAFIVPLLSVFGLFPIFAFIIRNKKPVNFEEYIKSRYYGMYTNPYVNNPNNYTDGNKTNYSENKEPFGYKDVHKTDDENPFPEFDDKDKK